MMKSAIIKLFEDKNLIFIATLMRDGSPQISPVWGDYSNGYILINTAEGRIKHKNILRDPRVAVSVVDHKNSLNMTTIRGRVIEIARDYNYKHADRLTKKYMNKEKYPFKQPNEKRIILKIIPEKIFVMPKLQMNQE